MLQMSVRRDYGIDVVEGALSSLSPTGQLRDWLCDRWALLFSHPGDFADYGFEADRWLVYLQDTFASLQLRTIGVGYGDESSWLAQLGGRFLPGYEVDDLVPQLRGRKQNAREHFVVILDGEARARRTFLYQPGSDTPSIIGLAQMAARLCERASSTSVRRILQSV